MLNRRHIGLRIKARRRRLGLTQHALGATLVPPRSQRDIWRWETGQGCLPAETLPGLCQALRIGPDWLLADPTPTEEELR